MALWRAATLLFVLSHTYGQGTKTQMTTVQIAGWTSAGERVDKIWVVLSSLNGPEQYSGDGRDVKLTIPVGEYMLEVEAPGFQSKRQVLNAHQPAVFRSTMLPIAWIHGQTASSLAGSVRNYAGRYRDLRVRLMALYGDELWESVLDSRDRFSFPAQEGTYLLVVVADLERGPLIMDIQPVLIPREWDVTITVDLKGKPGTPVPPASGDRH